jgi:hypothetical protein
MKDVLGRKNGPGGGTEEDKGVICVLKHWRRGVVKDRMHEIETDVRVLD